MSRRKFSVSFESTPSKRIRRNQTVDRKKAIYDAVSEMKSFVNYDAFREFFYEDKSSFVGFNLQEWVFIASLCPLERFDWICSQFTVEELRKSGVFCDEDILCNALTLYQETPEVIQKILIDYLGLDHSSPCNPCIHGSHKCHFLSIFYKNGENCFAVQMAEIHGDEEFVKTLLEINDLIDYCLEFPGQINVEANEEDEPMILETA